MEIRILTLMGKKEIWKYIYYSRGIYTTQYMLTTISTSLSTARTATTTHSPLAHLFQKTNTPTPSPSFLIIIYYLQIT